MFFLHWTFNTVYSLLDTRRLKREKNTSICKNKFKMSKLDDKSFYDTLIICSLGQNTQGLSL